MAEPVERFEVLGPLRLHRAGRVTVLTGSHQARLLEALLAVAGREIPAATLADHVWGDRPPVDPRAALRVQVSRIRTLFGSGPGAPTVEWSGQGYRLRLEGASLDLDDFARHHRRALELRPTDPVYAGQEADRALALVTGEPFPASDDLDHVAAVVRRVHEDGLLLEEILVGGELEAGRHEQLVPRLRELVTAEPYREERHRLLAIGLARSGRHREAVAALSDLHRTYAEVGLRAGPETLRLEQAILDHDPELVGASRGAPARFGPGNLGPEPGVLVGRDRDLATVAGLLDAAAVVTLVGPGGVGKTSLARVAAAAATGPHPGGRWFVDLTAVPPGAAIDDTVAQTVLGPVRDAGHDPAPAVERLVTALGDRPALVVLDNCEHVLPEVRSFLRKLADRHAEVTVLCTSRGPLGVPGEHVVRVAPLTPADATSLFVALAARSGHRSAYTADELAVIGDVCTRLDGLPLAVELASGWATVLDPHRLRRALDDDTSLLADRHGVRPTRHRSLDASLAWSTGLLEAGDRRLLDVAGGFAGAFDGYDLAFLTDRAPADAALGVARLIDASLAVAHPRSGTARLHPMVAAFVAGNRPPETAEADRRRLAELVTLRIAQLERDQRGPRQVEAWEAGERYEPTVQRVLDDLAVTDPDRMAAIVGAHTDFWYATGRRPMAVRRVRQAAELATAPTVHRARVLTHLAAVESTTLLAEHRATLEEAVAIFERHGERDGQTWAALYLAQSCRMGGDVENAGWWLRRARECAAADPWSAAVVNVFAIGERLVLGHAVDAMAELVEAVEAFAAMGDAAWHARGLVLRAGMESDTATAAALIRRGIELAESIGDRSTAAHARFGLFRLADEHSPGVRREGVSQCIDDFEAMGDARCATRARAELERLAGR